MHARAPSAMESFARTLLSFALSFCLVRYLRSSEFKTTDSAHFISVVYELKPKITLGTTVRQKSLFNVTKIRNFGAVKD